jgi:aspartyl-tRNA(Asn)/glutamyl-tRNA(Gln) amidotransferase subunit B
VSQRSKEEAHDYRYFPEPDLPPLDIARDWVTEIRERLPELAPERCARFERDFGLPPYDARVLTASKAMADYFEEAARLPMEASTDLPPISATAQLNKRASTESPLKAGAVLETHCKQVSNWMLGDLSGLLNLENRDIADSPVSPENLVEMIGLVGDGTISVTMAKTVLEEVYDSGASPRRIVEERGYTQISDTSTVEPVVLEALEANPRAVADYLNGKESAAKFLVGQVMKITRGQAKPDLVNQLVTDALERVKSESA